MASRVRVAASACLVASGLFIGGAGGAIAVADTGSDYGTSDDRQSNDSLGETIRRVLGIANGSEEKASDARNGPDSRSGNGRSGQEVPGDPADKEPPTTTKPEQPTTTKPTPCPDPNQPAPGQPPPPESRGGGGGGIVQIPRFEPPEIPDMQLPDELQPGQPGSPGGPAVIDAGAGAAAGAAPVGPAAPIALPVIVGLPIGLGGGAGAAGSAGAPPGAPPAMPRAVTAEPPAGRVPPANVGSNAPVSNSSYRIGYTEYLRSAGLPQVAALAVPGLAGILVLTSAGGLIGYRQAKAGHAVRAAGTARFMR